MAEGCGRSLQQEGTESCDRVLIKTLVCVLSIEEMYIELLPAQKNRPQKNAENLTKCFH